MIRWVIGGGFLVVFVAMYFLMRAGWSSRRRRQASIAEPTPAPAREALSAASHEADLFYVATTRADDRLDRIVVGGLAFRGRAVVSVHPEGVVLDIAGARPLLIEQNALRSIGRATWTIDRVVETDGLVQLGWRLGDLDVDSYLRSPEGSTELIDAISNVITTSGKKPLS